jgi:thiol-disulfide isomerase/thioredoxin
MKNILILFSFLFASPVFSQITVEGNVTDANGKIPILAHAHIGAYNDMKKSTSTECSKDGHFVIKIPKAGIYSLRISAVDHEETSIPLVVDEKDKNITMNIQLRANPFNKEPEKITIIGDWNKFTFASPEQMTPQRTADGKTIYTYERPASGDTLSYQLMGIAGGHSVNGTQADYFTYDGGGDYRSVIRTHKGDKVTITFDPSKINYAENSNLPNVEVTNNLFLKKIISFEQTRSAMNLEALKPMPDGSKALTKTKLQALREFIVHFIETSKASGDMRAAQFAAVMLSNENYPQDILKKESAQMILNTVPPTSPFWCMNLYGPVALSYLADSAIAAKYLLALQQNPVRSVRAVAFVNRLEKASKANNKEDVRRYYDLLKKEYGDESFAKYALLQFNPDAAVQVGKPVPDFEVALLDGSGKVSNISMLGKYYMIDFWATWCGPCVGEMPSMHKAYEKFKGKKGFEIISLSMDGAESQIAPFRAKKWKMPWLNAFIPGVWDAEIAKKFEVAMIPKPILVGPDGKIVATENELRGEDLEKTLGKYLGESN